MIFALSLRIRSPIVVMGSELARSPHMGAHFACALKENSPAGSTRFYLSSPPGQKNFACAVGQINSTDSRVLSHKRGGSRSSRNAGRDAVDAKVSLTSDTDADGKVVWS
jgi:hypothetical protein